MMLIEEYVLGGCGTESMVASTHNMSDGREERVARYKEERRRELAAQFGPRDQASGVRSTRASRLRTQANRTSNLSDGGKVGESSAENFTKEVTVEETKDKSKRKNLVSRSHTSDAVLLHRTASPSSSERKKETTRGRNSTSLSSASPVPKSALLVKKLSSAPTRRNSERGRSPEKSRRNTKSPSSSPVTSPRPRPVKCWSSEGKGEGRLSSPPCSPARQQPPGILKKAPLDSAQPVSILKRNSREEGGGVSLRCLSPVRWSTRVEPSSSSTALSNSRGILKKHRSLEEPQASLLIDQQNGLDDCRSILKGQARRCSLEEVKRNQSPESQPQSILKRKTSREESGDSGEWSVPPSILKRKGSSPVRADPVSPTKELDDPRRPILKKKSLSCEEAPEPALDAPRPILKKKSLEEEPPVRPILKTKSEEMQEIRPILKHTEETNGVVLRSRNSSTVLHNRRSLDPNFVYMQPKLSDRRPLSIAERIHFLETSKENEIISPTDKNRKMEEEESCCGLTRSGSVSERASMWNKLEQDSKAAAEAAARKVPKGTRGRSARGDPATRFSTQPVTLGEVEQARRNNQPLDCVEEDDEPSRLSLAERVRLFSGRPPVQPATTSQPSAHKQNTLVHSATSSIVAGLLKNIRDKATGGVSPVKRNSLGWESGSEGRRDSGSSVSSDSEDSALSVSPPHSYLRGGGSGMVGGVVLSRCSGQEDEPDGASVGSTIAERLAALQRSGSNDWRNRIKPPNDEEKGMGKRGVAERLGKLETASQGWKSRVEQKDSHRFTVAGRMAAAGPLILPPLDLLHNPRTPPPQVFTPQGTDSVSTPVSPENDSNVGYLKRSASAPASDHLKRILNGGDECPGPIVAVPEVCDESFHSFFPDYNPGSSLEPSLYSDDIDFEQISTGPNQLLVTKKRVRARRKHHSANPLRALAQRSDLKTEYVEVRSAAADREIRRINLDRLSKRNPGLAVEALAGLAAKEDLAQVILRKAAESPQVKQVAQWTHPLLLRVKGRRHPITCIVEPLWSNVNHGDAFILVTSSQVYCWYGEFCNVIEKSRATEVANEIQTRRDLGCLNASKVTSLDGTLCSPEHKHFWTLLNLPSDKLATYKGEEGGHPVEDEVYESELCESYRVYSLKDGKLVPVDDAWGKVPKIEVLDQTKVMVFDLVTEVFCWCGKQTSVSERKKGGRAAAELWKEAKWAPCGLGWMDKELADKQTRERVFTVTQHMEPVLFREKFSDWPDFKRNNSIHKAENGYSMEGRSCDIKPMVDWNHPCPDLILEGSHLGRGNKFYDEETRRYYQVSTQEVKVWRIEDYATVEMSDASVGHFLETHSYIIRWKYTLTVTGRELSGEPSKHQASGRDRVAYITWQGKRAGLEGGAAALLAVGMEPGAPQLILRQGCEPPFLLHLLPGPLVVHPAGDRWPRLYLVEPGQDEGERACLRHVPARSASLRSAASFWYIADASSTQSLLWHGMSTTTDLRNRAREALNHVLKSAPSELRLRHSLQYREIYEGAEPNDFLDGVMREEYLPDEDIDIDVSAMKMFELSPVKGIFTGVPVPPLRYNAESPSPWRYLYTQEDLVGCQSQCVLLDSGRRGAWLWVRCSVPPASALTTLLAYASAADLPSDKVFIVAANSEPLDFTNLFPWWSPSTQDHLPMEGWRWGEKRSGESEVSKLAIRSYPVEELTSHPLPAGVDPTKLELYLEPSSFKEVLGVSKEDFDVLPSWKQKKLKKSAGLF